MPAAEDAARSIFRFEHGSLLTVGITTAGSAVCIDLMAGMVHLTTNYQIAGGTGRFKRASGDLTLPPVLFKLLAAS